MAISRRGLTAALLLLLGGGLLAAPVPVRPEKPDEVLLAEVSVPPAGFADANKPSSLKIDLGKTSQIAYADTGTPQTKLRDAVGEAQLLLWATSPALPPAALRARMQGFRRRVALPAPPQTSWTIPKTPADTKAFEAAVYAAARNQARLVYHLERQIERLDEVADLRKKECKRWQANYDLMRAWLLLRIIHMEEVSLALGRMRKELPMHDPKQDKAFVLSPREAIRDHLARNWSRKVVRALEAIANDYPDTVWADLASRYCVQSLGVGWVAMR